jgi:hypothetical protein
MITPELGLWDECVDALKRAVAEAPSRINYHASLAACLSHQRQFPAALKALESAEPYAKMEQHWLLLSHSYSQVGAVRRLGSLEGPAADPLLLIDVRARG